MHRFQGWTEQKIKELQDCRKISGYKHANKNIPHTKESNIPKRSKAKDWLGWNLPYWCNEHAVTLETEYSFHPARKWRFDYAIPALLIAVEYEGIFSEKSRHTTVNGYNGDVEKYNAAQALGWKVIRLTAKNYKNVLNLLNEMV